MRSIEESGMTFGPYDDADCFWIEKSKTYQTVQDGMKMAEFLLLRRLGERPPCIWIVEAKRSSPHPKNQQEFDDFIGEIREKMENAIGLGIACMMKRHVKIADEVPSSFCSIDLSVVGFRFVLVMNGHQEDWLEPLQKALQTQLKVIAKAWSLGASFVVVVNHEMAKEKGLISAA